MKLVCFPKRTSTNAGRNYHFIGRIAQTPKKTTVKKAAFIEIWTFLWACFTPLNLDMGLLGSLKQVRKQNCRMWGISLHISQ